MRYECTGYLLFKVTQKLKATKSALKVWSQSNQLATRRQHIEEIRRKPSLIQQSCDLHPSNTDMHTGDNAFSVELEHWLSMEESQLRQKSRDLGLQLGDRNSNFFHAKKKT